MVIRVPKLGKNGLNNDGEPLTLRRPDGVVVSRAPATPKPKAGQSVARIHPKAPDYGAASFVRSEENASTPGAVNVVE